MLPQISIKWQDEDTSCIKLDNLQVGILHKGRFERTALQWMADSYSCSNHQVRCVSFWFTTAVLTYSASYLPSFLGMMGLLLLLFLGLVVELWGRCSELCPSSLSAGTQFRNVCRECAVCALSVSFILIAVSLWTTVIAESFLFVKLFLCKKDLVKGYFCLK